jgi:hypothetical protein
MARSACSARTMPSRTSRSSYSWTALWRPSHTARAVARSTSRIRQIKVPTSARPAPTVWPTTVWPTTVWPTTVRSSVVEEVANMPQRLDHRSACDETVTWPDAFSNSDSPRTDSTWPVSPRLVSPRLVSPRLVSPRPVSPRPVSPRPVSPRPVSPRPVSPGPAPARSAWPLGVRGSASAVGPMRGLAVGQRHRQADADDPRRGRDQPSRP